ncbi:MAG TPA: site-2 protease family protein [Pyrinomonadaceae bacterium]|jgi:membrane-associated protease RseP (regulator of RpoE activity)
MHTSLINIVFSFVVALVLHELGHFLAARACQVAVTEAGFGWGPRLYRVRVRNVDYHLRLLPLGAYIRMDMTGLQTRALPQQLFVLFAGVAVNLMLAALAPGTFFGSINLALAIGNLLPLYQQDGWKGGMLICRRVFGRPSQLVEWSFTISGGLISLAFLALGLFSF